MKIDITSLALMTTTLSAVVNAWSFYVDNAAVQIDSDENEISCDQDFYGEPNDTVAFFEGTFENCKVLMYMDSYCEDLYGVLQEDGDSFEIDEELWSYSAECSW